MPNQPKTPLRNIRIEDELYKPALAKAHREGTTITAVIKSALRRYLEEGET